MEIFSTCCTWPDQRNSIQIKTVSDMAEMWLDFWILWLCLYFCTQWRSHVWVTPCELIWTLTWCSSWFQMHSAGCVWWKCDLWSTSTLFPLLQVLLVCLVIHACSRGAYGKHRKSNRYNPFVEKNCWMQRRNLFFFLSPVPVMTAVALPILGCMHTMQNTAVVEGENNFLKGNRSLASLGT